MSPLILMTLATVGLAQVAPPPEEPSAPPPPDKEEVIVLNPFEVKASSNVGYRAESTASSGRYVQAYVDIPQTVDVITSEFMRDFNLTDSR
ncbi:MAG: hypothetical protein HYV75_06140, partial [Opitutae bacterium]|nr:hypothetical protein [Opitutae bacterium]